METKPEVDVANALTKFYSQVASLRLDVQSDLWKYADYGGDRNAMWSWLDDVKGYTFALEKRLAKLRQIATNTLADNKYSWDLLNGLEDMFDNEGSAAVSRASGISIFNKNLAEDDPLSRVPHININQWQNYLVSLFIQHLQNKNEFAPERKYEILKYLYSIDSKKILESMKNILKTFRPDSDLIKSYNRLKKSLLNGNTNFETIDPVCATAPVRKEMSLENFCAQGNEDDEETDETQNQLNENITRAVKRAVEKGEDLQVLRGTVSDYLNRLACEGKVLSIYMAFFGPTLGRNSALEEKVNEYNIKNLGGLDEAKKEFGNHMEKLVKGETKRKHTLLYGPPGTGKTSIVYSLANQHKDLKIISLRSPGELEVALRLIPNKNPYLLYVDDKSTFGSPDQLELWCGILDGKYVFPNNVEVVLTTNMERMPEKIIQRFGLIKKFGIPAEADRAVILDIYAQKFNVNISKIKDELIKKTNNFSGREIKNLFETLDEEGNIEEPEKLFGIIEKRQSNKPTVEPQMYR